MLGMTIFFFDAHVANLSKFSYADFATIVWTVLRFWKGSYRSILHPRNGRKTNVGFPAAKAFLTNRNELQYIIVNSETENKD